MAPPTPASTPMLWLLGFEKSHLRLQKNLHTAGCPYSRPCAKEISVFGPNGAIKGQCGGKHRPVLFIPAAQTFLGILLVELIDFAIDRLDEVPQILKRCRFIRTRSEKRRVGQEC